jgi:UDP-N-acetylglucosamine 1-carboxyvinyltransferase
MYCHGQTVPGRLTLTTVLFTLTRVSERFVVTGGNRLSGSVAVTGAKNSVLKLMAAALLAEGTSTITNCPDILDVPLMAEVLRGLGANVELDGSVARVTSPDEL